jgi:hypothetical protein
MPELQDLELTLTVDQVLRAQGANPALIRERSPRLVEIAEQALIDGSPLLRPRVLYHEMAIQEAVHERIKLTSGGALKGSLVSQHLLPAERVIVILCTIGPHLEQYAAEVMAADMVAGLALEGVGSAAVESLANLACNSFEAFAAQEGQKTTMPLSPGMIGWPVEEGQPQIFKLLDGTEIGVTLTPSYMMVPRKSLTMVVGAGRDLALKGTTCDYCSLRETCLYKEHYV